MSDGKQAILDAAQKVAKSWDGDWSIYLGEIARLCGMSLQEAMLFDMLLTWREINIQTRDNVAFVKKHIEDEHGPEDWNK